ncbi:hypothetical protein F9L07_19610 [Pimelobacter simplex]|uniref:Uncharacterized protein n=1 Tax=Nocardioides simplex TaxID=2045 RepID=A0A7J5DVM1_NOCSI|nr:DUF6221 family protein [Pimelobacter simplex]KAB2809250.1 hypothetical protein F9L07_19610 [Pimelobacter simplex]
MTITEFLLARIAEDEAVAQRALGERYMVDGGLRWGEVGYETVSDLTIDPARVLAECEAKRRIVELHQSWPVLVEAKPTFEPSDPTDLNAMTFRMSKQIAWATEQEYRAKFGVEPPSAPMLRALASVYADHPDFREEWRS